MNLLKKAYKILEKYMPILTVVFFLLGIWIASVSLTFAKLVNSGMSGLCDVYQYIAPIAIYVILTPSLGKMLMAKKSKGGKFVGQTIAWFASIRLLACLFGAVFAAIIFGLPLYINGTITFWQSILKTLTSIGHMLVSSTYFYALYASAFTILLSLKFHKISNFLGKAVDGVEMAGKFFVPLVPLIMLAVGGYVYYLPTTISADFTSEGLSAASLKDFQIFGFTINSHTATGMIMAYLAGGLLTGLACAIWHLGLIIMTKLKIRNFSITNYFKNYWIRIYPLLWATSSEAIATPLNLHLIKQYYPKIKSEIRRFVMGSGSFLNINGTIICVFVMTGLVCRLLGVPLSFAQLFLIIPLVFLIGYGVAGIPGELLLFAGPIAGLLAVPALTIPIFLAVYIGFQFGLPDSFRTGGNQTDNCLYALLRNETYNLKFDVEPETPVFHIVPETLEVYDLPDVPNYITINKTNTINVENEQELVGFEKL